MGVLASVARHEPDAISDMQNHGRPAFDRMLLVPEPRPLSQLRAASAAPAAPRARGGRPARTVTPAERQARFGTPVTGGRAPVQRPAAPRYDETRRRANAQRMKR